MTTTTRPQASYLLDLLAPLPLVVAMALAVAAGVLGHIGPQKRSTDPVSASEDVACECDLCVKRREGHE